tara:strand:+ start:763 stop:882 length:120 start_codon:yes stop_codon:yes gene_type:complete
MFAPYMNIVYLEGRIAQLNELATKEKDNDKRFVYGLKSD